MSISVFLSIQGSTLRLRKIVHDETVGDKPPKGFIRGFSHQSRNRLLRWLNSVDWALSDPTLFITLTYPDSVPNARMRDRRNHRNAFVKGLERLLGCSLGILWRQEWITRKTGKFIGHLRPHYHLLVFGTRFILKEDVRNIWRRAINYDEPPLSTDVRAVKGKDGAIRYVAKYLSKNPSLDICTYLDKNFEMGRFWGILHPELIPRFPERVTELTDELQMYELLHQASDILKRNPDELMGGFTLLGDEAKRIWENFGN